MPNITAKTAGRNQCGNDKCGTFHTEHVVHERGGHRGGKPMKGSGGSHSAFTNKARHITGKGSGKAPKVTSRMGHGTPRHSAYRDADGDYD